MNAHRATKLAIECIEREIKRLSVNANLEDTYHSGIPMCVEASRHKELYEAIRALREPMQTRMETL